MLTLTGQSETLQRWMCAGRDDGRNGTRQGEVEGNGMGKVSLSITFWVINTERVKKGTVSGVRRFG